jgi:ankyrin repeat protein
LELLVQSGNCPYSGSNPVLYHKECQPKISSLHKAARSNASLRWSSQSEFYESNKEFAEAPVDYHMRPLHWAAHKGNTKLAITLMCLFGVDVNARACGDLTPLHFAANSGNPAITNSLLEFGADPNALSSNLESPLHLVTTWQAASLLAAAGANVSEKDSSGNSPLHEAAIYGRLPVMRVLLKNGADINALNKKGDTALFETLAFNHPKGSHLLIDAGADPLCTGRDYLPAKVAKNLNISPDILPKVLRPEPSSPFSCIPYKAALR